MKCVYKIVCRDKEITEFYIGSSMDFTKRKRHHKSDCNNLNRIKYNYKVYKFIRDNGGFENWEFEVINEYKFITKKELNINEQYYKDLLKPTLNSKEVIINKKENIKKWNDKKNKLKANCPFCCSEMLKTSLYRHIKICKENKPFPPKYCCSVGYPGSEWDELADIMGIDLK